MSGLTWETAYEFGIPEIDQQHKNMLKLLNVCYEHLAGTEQDFNAAKHLDEAIDYALYHFTFEEKFLNEIDFPHRAEQNRLHRELYRILIAYKGQIESKKRLVSSAITDEMKKWINEHILIEDMKYLEYFRNAVHQRNA